MSCLKISFLFALGLCLVYISLLNDFSRSSDIKISQNKELFLHWDGAQLVIIKSKNKAVSPVSTNNIPPRLCPVFFLPIPLNHADKELLITLPDVGPITAERILSKKLEIGNIVRREQLMSIKGIGEKTAKKIEQYSTYKL